MKPDLTLIFPRSEFLINEAVFPPLGILYLSAYLKQHGLEIQCLDMGLGHTLEMIESEIVGVSFSTPQRDAAFDVAKTLKGTKILVAGGPHPTHMRDECLDRGFDFAFCGYAEEQLLRFLKCNGHSQPIDINALPFPDRDAIPIKDYHYEIDGKPATPIMTSRGCPYRCSFCAKISDEFHIQSAERTISEIEHIHERYGFEAFMIFDDVFIASKTRIKVIADALEGRFTFRCFARTNLINEAICDDLARLGVVEVGLGIESGSSEILDRNMKGTSPEMNLKAVKMLKKHGIRVKVFMIVGLPGESEETMLQTALWVDEAKPDDIDFTIFNPLPGSRIFNHPETYGVTFKYNGAPLWYKGTPGKYQTSVATEDLSGERLIALRDWMETKYKNKELLK